ncbi:F-box domain-containing protein [Mycena chlorophos]|uniref:F-box domain-containing protein n=1 Tax=Mycena chlorophos TaxID=658473 RepID=A0A8H6W629_MYCCL|nr:F-box domain-containing protein [Mycena chlorophos]
MLPTSTTHKVPNEIWLTIFGLLDPTDLRNVVLASRRFNVLGTEPLVRHITWQSATKAKQHIQFWRRGGRDKVNLVRQVTVVLPGLSREDGELESIAGYDQIFSQIARFRRLRHLRLSGGKVPEVLYKTLEELRWLDELSLSECLVPSPPASLSQFFFTSGAPSLPQPTINVKRLNVSKIKTTSYFLASNHNTITIPLALRLTNLRTFVTDNFGIQIPVDISAQLTSLTINLGSSVGDMQDRLDNLLRRMPQLKELHVASPTYHAGLATQGNANNLLTLPVVALSRLTAVSAPWPAAFHVMRGALSTVKHVRINSSVFKNADMLTALEAIRASEVPLRSMAFRIATWDDEVLLAAARCLPKSCEALEVMYFEGTPDEDFLFNLGIHQLPLLPALHTFRLIPFPSLKPLSSPRTIFQSLGLQAQQQPVHGHGHVFHLPPLWSLHHHMAAVPQAPIPIHQHHIIDLTGPQTSTLPLASPTAHHVATFSHLSDSEDDSGDDNEDDGLDFEFPLEFHNPPLPAPSSSLVPTPAVCNPPATRPKTPTPEPEPTEKELAWTEQLREAIHVWARYNPNLVRVRLGREPKNGWVKMQSRFGVGKGKGKAKMPVVVWELDLEDSEEQDERWMRMMRENLGDGEEDAVPAT